MAKANRKTQASAKKKEATQRKAKKTSALVQFAALPFRLEDYRVSVLMVTSRETQRWILPKGYPELRMKPHSVAELEAFEEAGVRGEASLLPFGRYQTTKRLDDGSQIPCEMIVYPLKVHEVLDDWPERGQRQRQWLSPAEAAVIAGDDGLIGILLDFASLWP